MANEGQVRTVKYEDGELQYDADMRMGDLRKLFSASKSGDLETMMDAYKSIIIAWPYDGDPSTDEAWDNIRKSEFAKLNEALMQDLGDEGEA